MLSGPILLVGLFAKELVAIINFKKTQIPAINRLEESERTKARMMKCGLSWVPWLRAGW